MERYENVSLSVTNLDDAIKEYVKSRFPEYEGREMKASMYPGLTFVGDLSKVKDEDNDRAFVTVTIKKD